MSVSGQFKVTLSLAPGWLRQRGPKVTQVARRSFSPRRTSGGSGLVRAASDCYQSPVSEMTLFRSRRFEAGVGAGSADPHQEKRMKLKIKPLRRRSRVDVLLLPGWPG